jgi:hypothetical protein
VKLPKHLLAWLSLVVVFVFLDKPPREILKNVSIFTFRFYQEPSVASAKWFGPSAGGEVIPSISIQIRDLSLSHHFENYDLSQKIRSDPWIFQQTLATAWPLKLRNDSPDRFFAPKEALMPGCIQVDQKSEVILAKCQ